MAEHLQAMCAEMCNDKQYRFVNGDNRLYTIGVYRIAMLRLGDKYIIFRLQDLQTLLRILYMVHVQQIRYLDVLPEIINYEAVALTLALCGTTRL
jgi:hypothetical protein